MANETYLHSASGGLAAGNYDFFGEGQVAGDAFVVDMKSGKQTNFRYNDAALSHAVYGIWSNGGSSYTVAGGVSSAKGSLKPGLTTSPSVSDASLADYDSITGKVNHLHTDRYPGSGAGPSLETHFEGIWSDGDGLYKLPFWSFDANLKPAGAGLAIIQRLKNGEFSDATWITFPNPAGVTVYTNDSVWARASVGGQISSSNPWVFDTYAALTSIS